VPTARRLSQTLGVVPELSHMHTAILDLLAELRDALAIAGESHFAGIAQNAIAGTELERMAFLESNDLWGGSGSIADQAGVASERPCRRTIEAALISLGQEQLHLGLANPRTASWIEVFAEWRRQGI
jgi:hypothetical protein